MQATAYDPTAGSKTAMGTRARIGAVAVDPRVIPLGSKLYIESADGFPTYGYAVAEDTGGAIKGRRIDLFYGSNAEARRFGRRNVVVYVLEN
ncbi:3D domain protein [Peptoniphilus sp. oral taxon 375 str. F0436]|nr:3D domain protein [Peptoniphilus sp. oral taxon 375 str. F0436]